jgi:UDPglucose 6-dehydrogenase
MAGGSLQGKRIGVWGLTFKARTDDLRESPSISVVRRLLSAGATVQAFDPTLTQPIDSRKAAVLDGIDVVDDPYAACEGAEVLLVLTEWEDFRWLDFDKAGDAMAARRVVDARNLLDRDAMRRKGFEYEGIGRR